MILKGLTLSNFRNYVEEAVTFSPKVNLIFGKNGAGKTNLLEALYLLSTGRSFRTTHLSDLIRKGASHFFINALFERDGVEQTLSIGYDGHTRKIHSNATPLQSFSHLLGILPSTLYAPRDGQLIAGSPQERRRFLNVQVAQSDPLYVHHLMRYHKALKQRNSLLKKRSEIGIEPWEEMMALSASYLMEKRGTLIKELQPRVDKYVQKLSDGVDAFALSYVPSISMKHLQDIQDVLVRNRRRELVIGTTLNGPHRDDFHIHYQNRDAKTFASEGQKRTCIGALKMSEWELLSERTGMKAIMGIDDFGIHLDEGRTKLLHEELEGGNQVFLTTPSEEHLESFSHDRLLFVEGGTISASNPILAEGSTSNSRST